jgi:CDP-diacylglycerol--serine O-phosphatidyltransferase
LKKKLLEGCAQLPNVVTFANLLCGITAIMLATRGYFLAAPLVIFGAGVLDVLDGVLARRFRGGDAFGEALDSLADIISFGIAPALLIYERFLQPWPVLGWVVAGGYAVCGAWRLARFAAAEKTPFFQGLPITMAGMSVSAFLFYPQFWSPRAVALITLVLAILMISHLRFPKVPMLLRPFPRPVRAIFILGAIVSMFVFSPGSVLTTLGVTYFSVALLENLGFWEAVGDGPVGDMAARFRERHSR